MLLERDSFLTDLTTLLQEARAGQGHLVLLSGEAGVGKTTLVKEFCRAVAEEQPESPLEPVTHFLHQVHLGPLLDVVETLGGFEESCRKTSRDHLFRNFLT